MFLINAYDIYYSKECQIQVGREGILVKYDTYTLDIPITRLKRFESNPAITKKNKYSDYELLDENKIIIIARIKNNLKRIEYTTDENCDVIVHWLRKNITA